MKVSDISFVPAESTAPEGRVDHAWVIVDLTKIKALPAVKAITLRNGGP